CARAGGFGGSCSGGCGVVAGLDAIDGAMGGFLLRRCAGAAEHVLAGGLAGVGHAGAALWGGLGGGLGGGLVVIVDRVHQHGDGVFVLLVAGGAVAGGELGVLAHHFLEGALDHAGAAVGELGQGQFVGIIVGDVLDERHAQLTASGTQRHVQSPQYHADDCENQNQYQEFTKPHRLLSPYVCKCSNKVRSVTGSNPSAAKSYMAASSAASAISTATMRETPGSCMVTPRS